MQNDKLFLKYYTFTICLKNCVHCSKSNMKSPGKLLCFQPVTPFEGLIFRREIQNLSTLLQFFLFFTTEPVMLRALRGAQEDRSEHFLSLFVTHFSIFFKFLSHVRHFLQEVVNAGIKYCKKMAERKLF